MAKFRINPERFDPYKNFKFRVKWDGRYVAGVSKVGALKRTTEPVEHREGGDPSTVHRSPGQTKYEAITLGAPRAALRVADRRLPVLPRVRRTAAGSPVDDRAAPRRGW